MQTIFRWLRMTDRPRPSMAVGREGELLALKLLRLLGYRVLGRNIRVGRGEIDLLAFDPGDRVLVFVEVKARRGHDYDPAINLTPRKREAMTEAARLWVERQNLGEVGYRLDLICVEDGRVTQHLKDVAWSEV